MWWLKDLQFEESLVNQHLLTDCTHHSSLRCNKPRLWGKPFRSNDQIYRMCFSFFYIILFIILLEIKVYDGKTHKPAFRSSRTPEAPKYATPAKKTWPMQGTKHLYVLGFIVKVHHLICYFFCTFRQQSWRTCLGLCNLRGKRKNYTTVTKNYNYFAVKPGV